MSRTNQDDGVKHVARKSIGSGAVGGLASFPVALLFQLLADRESLSTGLGHAAVISVVLAVVFAVAVYLYWSVVHQGSGRGL